MSRWLFSALLCIGFSAAAAEGVQIGCKRLELALDPALGPAAVEQAWGNGDPPSATAATLELRGCSGEVLDRMVLEASLARLERRPLRGTPRPTYLVSIDLTARAGSYNGPLTIPVEVWSRSLKRAQAASSDGKREPIHLAETGKAGWKKVRISGADDLLSVSVQPNDGSFVIFYRRYHPTRNGWTVRTRSEPGLWEADHPFPELRRFPH